MPETDHDETNSDRWWLSDADAEAMEIASWRAAEALVKAVRVSDDDRELNSLIVGKALAGTVKPRPSTG